MKRKKHILSLTKAAIFASLLAVTCPFTIPVGQIGITLATAVLIFSALLLKPSEAISATALYLALGAVGLPVFSGFSGGIGMLLSPSGGFLIGYLPFTVILSLTSQKTSRTPSLILALLLAHLALYATGTLAFSLITDTPLPKALAITTLPFLIPDMLKATLSLPLAKLTKKRIGE